MIVIVRPIYSFKPWFKPIHSLKAALLLFVFLCYIESKVTQYDTASIYWSLDCETSLMRLTSDEVGRSLGLGLDCCVGCETIYRVG